MCHVADASGNVVSFTLKGPVTTLCEKCHEKILSEGYLHPVNVVPRNVTVPEGFPLSRIGEITCTTCHDIHSPYFTPYGAPTHFLRRYEEGNRFCEACHKGSPVGTGHTDTMREAHFQSKYVETSASQVIDSISLQCVSCHDGSFATSSSIRAGSWGHKGELMTHDSGTHPIGVDYEGARLRKGRKAFLHPMDAVDPRIRFFDGKVGCGSCHDPYSNIEKRLVMSDRGSKLCFACHMLGK